MTVGFLNQNDPDFYPTEDYHSNTTTEGHNL